MSTDATVHFQTNGKLDFDSFFHHYERRARKESERLARQLSKRLDIEDAEDIFIIAMAKLYQAYWRPDARNRYEHISDKHGWALVQKTLDSAAIDLVRKRDTADWIVCSLDDPIFSFGDGDNSSTRADTVAASDNVSGEACARIDLEEAIQVKLKAMRSEGVKKVIAHLCGECSRGEIEAEYDDNYIRVNIHNVKHHVLRFFGKESD